MNKKKEYKKPTMDAIALRHTQLLADSGQQETAGTRQYIGGFDDDE